MSGNASGLRRKLGGTNVLARYPRLYLALARRRYGGRVLGPGTDIVIEGFPRSANTFAVAAFELAQERPVTVAHHLHTAAHVVRAVAAGVPVILLVRRPEEAIVSVILRKPELEPASVAAAYLRFYEGVGEVLDACVVAEFEQVIGDYGSVIERVNRRYATAFTLFEHTDENVSRSFGRIETQNRRRAGGRLVESAVARPSQERTERAAAVRRRVEALPADLRARLARAYDLTAARAVP